MTTNDIRTKFLNFFKSKGHSIIPSDSLVPKDDPTVLFTTAGMQQFKPQFLGHLEGFTRAATCQKCLRTDDLDVVGKTDFHHTFFEMLGNFSFGDYFKKEAIHWAWEFLTQELRLPVGKLWVSVYKDDEEAYAIWANEIKVPVNRIIKLGDKSNFWPSEAKAKGPNGPCGPCSEIFYDYGINPKCPKGKDCDPDCSCGRFSEVWNLVFTQFNRKDGGLLEPLPAKNIDTGMGLERLVAVVQGKKSNYETDNFTAILKVIKDAFAAQGAKASESEFRIIADHMRAVVVGIADGVMPSNEGRGYVMRKLIVDMTQISVRAGIKKSMVHSFVCQVVEVMRGPYPELVMKINEISEALERVENAVIKINEGREPIYIKELMKLKQKYLIEDQVTDFFNEGGNVTASSEGVFNQELIDELGRLMFLYRDTYGLDMDTIQLKAREFFSEEALQAAGLVNKFMEEQKNRSRASSKMTGDVYANQDFSLNVPKTEFLGYKQTKAEAQVLKIINEHGQTDQAQQGHRVDIILDRTVFYAEAGGQVGDSGYLIIGSPTETFGDDKTVKVRVTDTQKANDIYIHSGVVEWGVVKTADKVQAVIDEPRRRAIMRNHTATHLLQAALRETLGGHIKQQGSLVEESRLRFDFTHPTGVKPEQIKKIENRIEEFINRADNVTTQVLPLEEAKKQGALAFFAEKYGQTVRVVSIGDYSKEFCGGTHVASTKDVECIKIISEGSVAQGIRRMEALTGRAAVDDLLNKKTQESAAIEEAKRLKQLRQEKQEAYFQQVKSGVDDLIAHGEDIKGAKLIACSLQEMDIGLLRKLSDLFRQKVKSGIFILGAKGALDASLILSITDDLVARGIKANELMVQIAPLLDGSGGGKPNLAQAGSKQPQKLDTALIKAKEIVAVLLRGT